MTKPILMPAFAALLLLALLPAAGAQGAAIGGEYSCSTLTMRCSYRTAGYHTGLPGFTGTSSWGASSGACTILLTSCQSRGPWAVAPYGSCYPAFAQTQGLWQAAGVMCMP